MIDSRPRLTYRPNHRRARITVIALGVCVLISVLTVVFSFTALELFQRLDRNDFTMAEITTFDERARTLALFDAGAYLVTAIIFLFWIYRAYHNHAQLARRGSEYSPNWAVFGFIIPIISLVRPYQVVREMWDEIQADDTHNPLGVTPSHATILIWWWSFLAMNFITRLYSTAATAADSPAGLTSATTIDMVVQVATIMSAVLAIRIVRRIDTYHDTRQQQLQSADIPTDRPGWSPLVYAWSLGIGVIILGIVLFGSNALVDQIDQVIASAPTRAPARSTAPHKPAVTPTKFVPLMLNMSEYEEHGKKYLDAGEYDQALEAFSQALKGDPNNAHLHYLRGIAYGWLEDYDSALIDLNRAIKLTPKYTEAYHERGMTHLNLGNYGLANKDFDQALKLDAKYADAYIGRGWMHYLRDEYADALKDANQAIKLDKRAVDAYHVRGLIYLDTGKFDQAVSDFSEAIKLEPESASAFNRRGLAYHSAGDLDKALQDYEQALKLEPEYIDVYYNRGLVNYHRGTYQAALSDFNAVLKQYPQSGLAHLHRGATYAQLKEYDKAIADVEQALDLDLSASDRTDAEQLLEDLKAARKGSAS
jgi:tetratricopeptide (TPR) repeat protein